MHCWCFLGYFLKPLQDKSTSQQVSWSLCCVVNSLIVSGAQPTDRQWVLLSCSGQLKIEADFLRTGNWQEGLPSQKEGIFSQPLRRNIDYNDYSLWKLLHNLYSQASFVVWAEHYSRRRAWEGHRLRQVLKFYRNTSLIISPVSGHCVSLQCCEDLEHTWRGNWTGKELINLIFTSL